MAVYTSTRAAKCGDCRFVNAYWEGKRKYHKCSNPQSSHFLQGVTLKDLVCNVWKL